MGREVECEPSPFLDELPSECLSTPADETPLSAEEAARLFAEARRRMSGGGSTGTP